MPEILNQSRNMARAVDIPLVIDIDTGYGNALNLMRAVREFESAGLAGIFFEDQTFPKRCGHFEGKQVIAVEEMVVKIKAACETRRDDDFVIIARTDSRAMHGLDHAIGRGKAFAEAGADLVFVEALLSEEEMRTAASAIPVPLQANMSEAGKTPVLPVDTLHEIGFKLISYSGLLQRTAIRGMLDVLEILQREGTTMPAYPERICSLVERSEILGLQDFYALEERLYGPIVDTEGSWREALEAQADARKAGAPRKSPI
jgi:methylisocitrate lyase